MKAALLVVDVQHDYLARPGFEQGVAALLPGVARLLEVARTGGMPVVHVHTLIKPDGSDRMPHLARADRWLCVQDSPGAQAPAEAAPRADEPVFGKNVFNAFSNPDLAPHLERLGVDTVIVAGVHLHACVRETALAAYQLGLRVVVAQDAVASYDPLHAEITREYLKARDIAFMPTRQLCAIISPQMASGGRPAPAACVGGTWHDADSTRQWEVRNPARWDEVLGVVAQATDGQAAEAVAAAAGAQPGWAARAPEARAEFLARFAEALERHREPLTQAMVAETGKPARDARQEAIRAAALVRSVAARFGEAHPWQRCGPDVHARRAPLGVVAAITPFNHPLGIAVGKIAPALALGNTVVWKPSLAATGTARLVANAAVEAGLPAGLLGVVFGDGRMAQRLARHPDVAGVTVTASIDAGRQLGMICGSALKPLQAELGGNNAVLVLGEFDAQAVADQVAHSAFSFAGQRCTAGRRILVQREGFSRLRDALIRSVGELVVGEPADPATEVGPLISRAQQQAVASTVAAGVRAGAQVLCGGKIPPGLDHGCWYAPTLVSGAGPDSVLFREETFGPVAVLHPVEDLEQAIGLVNAVEHGLVATLYSDDPRVQRRFLDAVQAGVLKLNRPPAGVHAEAPFGGWKASGLGPPEHGPWDEEFYTRVQALYGFHP